MMSEIQELSPNEVLSCLWNQSAPEKCRIGLIDVVIYENGLPSRWYMTGKTGEITQKRIADKNAVCQRWKRINAQAESPIILIVRGKNGILTFLDEEACDNFFLEWNTINNFVQSIHCFVKSNQPSLYRNKFEIKDKLGRFVTTTQSYSYNLNSGCTTVNEQDCNFVDIRATSLRNIMDLATNTVVKYIERMLSVRVISLSVDYVVDSKSQLWMIWTSKAFYTAVPLHDAISDLPPGESGRMSWAGYNYVQGEAAIKASAGSQKPDSPQSSLLRKNTLPKSEASSTLKKTGNRPTSRPKAADDDSDVPKVNLEDANAQILAATSVINGTASESANKGKPKSELFSIQSKSSLQQHEKGTSRRGHLPLVFQCRGDFCHLAVQPIGALELDPSLEGQNVEKLFSTTELKVLKKYKRFNDMMSNIETSGAPGQATVPMRSILLAQRERRAMKDKEKYEERNWESFPTSPRKKQDDGQSSRAVLSKSELNKSQVSAMTDDSVLRSSSAGLRPNSRSHSNVQPPSEDDLKNDDIARDRQMQQDFTKNMTHYYEQARVCNVCHAVYASLDWARQILGHDDAYGMGLEHGKQPKSPSRSRRGGRSSDSLSRQSQALAASSSMPSLGEKSKKVTGAVMSKIDKLSTTQEAGAGSQTQGARTLGRGEGGSSVASSGVGQGPSKARAKATWKDYLDEEMSLDQSKADKSRVSVAEKSIADTSRASTRLKDLDNYLHKGADVLIEKKKKKEDVKAHVQNERLNGELQNGSSVVSVHASSAAEMYKGKIIFACPEFEHCIAAKTMLEEAFFEVTHCLDGRSAYNAFLAADGNVDCMLIERDLELNSAFTLVKYIRDFDKKMRAKAAAEAAKEGKGVQPHSRRVPVICFTSATSPADLKAYMHADMDGCVSYPVNKAALLSTVRAAVPHHLSLISEPPEPPPPPGAKLYHLGPLGVPEGSLDSSSFATKSLAFAASAEDNCSSTGFVQIDPDTRISYVVLDAGKKMGITGQPYFNLVVCHDLFDTAERLTIFFKPIVLKYVGLQVLLWNYPGQAFTEWREDQLLTSEFHTTCLNELLGQVGESGSKEFDTTKPFYMLGYGFGANIASFYTAHFRVPNLRGLLVVNGWSFVDSNLAAALHDCISVFQCTPSARPDLPVYFFSRFLFSKEYLQKVSVPLALNIYTAVFNPITLKGRISLCKGALSSMDLRPVLTEIDAPIICIQGTQDSFSRALHTEPFVIKRAGEVRSIHRALQDPDKTCVIWIKSGHEVFQECRKSIQTLLEQVLTGYHEKNEIAFPPANVVDERGLQQGLMINNLPGEESLPTNLKKSKTIEDKYIETLLGNMATMTKAIDEKGNKGMFSVEFQVKLEKRTLATFREDDKAWFCGEMARQFGVDSGAVEILGLAAGSVIVHARAWFKNKEDADNAMSKAKTTDFLSGVTGRYGKADVTQQKVVKNETLPRPAPEATNNELPLSAPEEANWSLYSKSIQTQQQQTLQDREPKTTTKQGSKKTNKKGAGDVSIILDPTIVAFEKQDNAIYSLNPAEYPEVKEYMSWRLKRNKKQLMRLHAAAKVVQTAYRAHLARMFVENLRRNRAAATIQRYYRGWLGRCRFLEQARRIWAAQLIQRMWRGYAGRLHAMEYRMKVAATINIQRLWRGFKARKFVAELRERRRIAATMIQSIFRRNKARKLAWRMRIERNAAIFIQRVYRGHLGRRRAVAERDRYIFSKSQTQGIEFGRQMLLEHKLHATRLQSDVALLTQEKVASEEQVEALLEEISSFEEGVRILEKEMHQLSKVESEAAAYLDEHSKGELREQKMRLDREFGDMLIKIGSRKEQLTNLELKLSSIDKARQLKEEELRTLERKLVVLLEEQQNELNAIKRKQDVRGALLAASHNQLMQVTAGAGGGNSQALVPAGSNIASASIGAEGGRGGPSVKERREAAQLMQSTETLMKFGFMSMSMTYFSSLNMIKALRTVSAQDTVMAALADVHSQRAANFGMEGANQAGKSAGADVLGSALGDGPQSKSAFLPGLKPGQLPGQEPLRVSAWSVEDVSRWLQTQALGQYCEAFMDAAIDGEFLYDLNDDDLKNTLGVEHRLHRKKLLNAIYRLKVAEAQRDSRINNLVHSQIPTMMDPELPEGMAPLAGSMDDAPLSEQEPGVRKSNQDPRLVEGPKVAFSELASFVRHSKFALLKEALDYLPTKKFERALVQIPYLDQIGTVYAEGYAKLVFHINMADEHGNSLLSLAGQNGNLKVAKFLLEKGSNPNHQNKLGHTPAHFAIAYHFYDFSTWLFENGGDDSIENSFGKTPYDGISE